MSVFNDLQVQAELHAEGYMCEADTDDSDTMNKKIRNAQLAQYNFILGTLLMFILKVLNCLI